MEKKEDRKNLIIQVTIALLGEEGADNLSMRKVAKSANISLSNLQYYYNGKDALLIATVEQYFKVCQEEVTEKLPPLNKENEVSPTQFFEQLLGLLLYNGKENRQTIMFREIAALSSRNKELDAAVDKYYKEYCIWLIELVSKHTRHPEKVVSLIVPYLEGFANMGTTLPLQKNDCIAILLKCIHELEK
nr:TetR/AcrR family transcriptional regulator [uncultured Sphingobacterium sp.]